ncbi:MAG: LysM peptidoglycan-binding domain-containing protein [Rothia sp. (in: high G+C Gram-positive bacteria)]|uniref:LysM peptidoglycan-binding domain-containing protein n=1 Tax=Rothia sp. (in: high G+C Gram-positive bacteria) TaxID=1885016 RepID=UPI0026E0E7BB|nr:LysM peptidoglycan-binding domain-containing protein [Rothia sp. (in: high G+C Gram-positive bacteria)]MDO5750119.1 LysM peptidoglycan-binding domain-containing protein [Rothia sp. (in: high G+C Gram-positive bacteria)]
MNTKSTLGALTLSLIFPAALGIMLYQLLQLYRRSSLYGQPVEQALLLGAMLFCALSILWWAFSCLRFQRYTHRLRELYRSHQLASALEQLEQGSIFLPRWMRQLALSMSGLSLSAVSTFSAIPAAQAQGTGAQETGVQEVILQQAWQIHEHSSTLIMHSSSASPFFPATPDPHGLPESHSQHTPQEYTVVCGDNLWDIARTTLGPGATNAQIMEYTLQIHRQNQPPLSSNPHLIYPGTRLILPAY